MWIIVVILCIYVGFILWLRSGLHETNVNVESAETNSLSILIPFRNEENNASTLLNNLQEMSGISSHQIILIDDHSNDGSCQIIEEFKADHPALNIHLIHAPESSHGKKLAIKFGLNAVQNNYVLQLDMDCVYPTTLLNAVGHYVSSNPVDVLILPVHIHSSGGTIGDFDEFEYASLQAVGLSMAQLNYPILCSGANLLYQTSLGIEFYKNPSTYSSGDDVFLLHYAISTHRKIDAYLSKNALAISSSASSFNHLINQRKRWNSKNKGVKDALYQAIRILAWSTNVCVLIAFALDQDLALSLFGIKLIVDFLFLQRFYRIIHQPFNNFAFILGSVFYPFYILYLSLASIRNDSNWKGRIVEH